MVLSSSQPIGYTSNETMTEKQWSLNIVRGTTLSVSWSSNVGSWHSWVGLEFGIRVLSAGAFWKAVKLTSSNNSGPCGLPLLNFAESPNDERDDMNQPTGAQTNVTCEAKGKWYGPAPSGMTDRKDHVPIPIPSPNPLLWSLTRKVRVARNINVTSLRNILGMYRR